MASSSPNTDNATLAKTIPRLQDVELDGVVSKRLNRSRPVTEALVKVKNAAHPAWDTIIASRQQAAPV
jgi:hypothetical protein